MRLMGCLACLDRIVCDVGDLKRKKENGRADHLNNFVVGHLLADKGGCESATKVNLKIAIAAIPTSPPARVHILMISFAVILLFCRPGYGIVHTQGTERTDFCVSLENILHRCYPLFVQQ